MFIASDANPETALDDYAKRRGIETLFDSLKTRGFGCKDTHLRDPERISKMVALLTIAFAWAHRTGEERSEIKPIPIKTFNKATAACLLSVPLRLRLYSPDDLSPRPASVVRKI